LIPEFWFWQSQIWRGGLFFCGGSFQIAFLEQYFFNKQVFKFSAFSFGGVFFVGIISSWFCPVAEIGFKVFRLCFGLLWF
jgi:hypothetical protein